MGLKSVQTQLSDFTLLLTPFLEISLAEPQETGWWEAPAQPSPVEHASQHFRWLLDCLGKLDESIPFSCAFIFPSGSNSKEVKKTCLQCRRSKFDS